MLRESPIFLAPCRAILPHKVAFRTVASLCLLILLDSIPSWSAAAGLNDLFAPGVTRSLDREIDKTARQNNLPSVAVGVFVPEKGDTRSFEGFADLKRRTKSAAFDQPFHIASSTKSIRCDRYPDPDRSRVAAEN